MQFLFKGLACLALMVFASAPIQAQDASNADAQANNPLADITAFNIQNYYIGEITGQPDATGNLFVLRFAQPLQIGDTNWLIRASLPFKSLPTGPGGSTISALGDFDIFAAYQIPMKDPALSFGIGPQLVAPIGDPRVDASQWQLGLANVFFDGRNSKFQYGYLLTYRAGLGSNGTAPNASVGAFQPFAFYQLGGGWYTGGAPIWSYNFNDGSYSIPIGLRLGKVIKRGKTVFNLFAEPQYSISDSGRGQPKWQVYFALNMQFL